MSLLDRWRLAEAAVADASLSMPARLVLFALTTFHNDTTGRCDPGYAAVGSAAGIARRSTVIDAVRELEAAGWVAVRKRSTGGKSITNAFALNFAKADSGDFNSTSSEPFAGNTSTPNSTPSVPEPTTTPAYGGGVVVSASRDTRGARADARAANGLADDDGDFARFFDVYPNQNNRKAAATAFGAAVASGVDPAAIIGGAERYADSWANSSGRRSKPMQAAKWLAAERWTDGPSYEPPIQQSGKRTAMDAVADLLRQELYPDNEWPRAAAGGDE